MDNLIGLYFVMGIIALFFEFLIANKFESIANEKGYSGYFWWCFFFNIIGYIMVAALPDKKGKEQTRHQIVTAIENGNKYSQQPSPSQHQQPQQTYWNNNLPPL